METATVAAAPEMGPGQRLSGIIVKRLYTGAVRERQGVHLAPFATPALWIRGPHRPAQSQKTCRYGPKVSTLFTLSRHHRRQLVS